MYAKGSKVYKMIVIGDHKQTDRVYKYTEYQKEKPSKIIKSKSTKRKLIRLDSNQKRINYDIWFKTLPKNRIEYLKRIGISDLKKIKILIHINYNLLPYDVRHALQTRYI